VYLKRSAISLRCISGAGGQGRGRGRSKRNKWRIELTGVEKCYNKKIVHRRFRPRCATHDVYLLIFIIEQNLGWSSSFKFNCYTLSPTRYTHDAPQSPLCENMTSTTKPEVHNVSQCCQRRTEPPPQATCTKIWRASGSVVWIRERTDK